MIFKLVSRKIIFNFRHYGFLWTSQTSIKVHIKESLFANSRESNFIFEVLIRFYMSLSQFKGVA